MAYPNGLSPIFGTPQVQPGFLGLNPALRRQQQIGGVSDLLTGLGIGLMGQGPSLTPQAPLQGLAQGLQASNQLAQQRRAQEQQLFQDQLASQESQRQAGAFDIQKQQAAREQQQYDQQQKAIQQLAQQNPDLGPFIQAGGQGALDAYLKTQWQPPTDVQKNYVVAGGDAKWGGLANYQKYLAQAGANNTTVNMPPAEKAYNTALGQQEGGEIGSISSDASKSRAVNDQLAVAQALRQQLQAAGTDTSRLLPIVTQISSMGQALGIDTSKLGGQTPDATAAAQALDSVTKKLALGNIGSGKDSAIPANNFSEADRNFVVGIAPNIADTPEGFSAKALIQQRVNQRSLDKEQMWNSGKYNQLDEGDYRRFKADWAQYVATHPLFSMSEKKQFKALVAPGGGNNAAPTGTTSAPASAAPAQLSPADGWQ